MRWDLTASIVMHVGILVAAFVVLPSPDKFKVEDAEMIPVDIVSIEDVGRRQATVKTEEKPVEKPAPKPVEVVKPVQPAPEVAPEIKTAAHEPTAEPPPPEKKEEPKKEEVKKEEPKPLDPEPLKDLIKDTVKDEPKKEEPKKEETKKVEIPKEKPKEKPKPEKKKPAKFDTDDIAAFLNKVDDKRTAPLKPQDEAGTPKQGEFNLSGKDDGISATLIDALRKRLAGCWSIPAGARAAQLIVKVRFSLNQDGTVSGFPEVVNASSDPLFQATAQSAVSAVMDCQAYDFLPQDKYDLWRDITINFNPNQMFPS
ncbi:hypothetical protein BH10PSE7_BH10PSE7_33100 [soil metagenome]